MYLHAGRCFISGQTGLHKNIFQRQIWDFCWVKRHQMQPVNQNLWESIECCCCFFSEKQLWFVFFHRGSVQPVRWTQGWDVTVNLQSVSMSERSSPRTEAEVKSVHRAADGTHGGVGLDETLLQHSGFLPATGHTQTLQLTHLPAEHVSQRTHSANRTYTTRSQRRESIHIKDSFFPPLSFHFFIQWYIVTDGDVSFTSLTSTFFPCNADSSQWKGRKKRKQDWTATLAALWGCI